MRHQLNMLDLDGDFVIDSFAGGGGASTGIEQATGRAVNIAINHNETALGLHAVNHPDTRHMVESVWYIKPQTIRRMTEGKPVSLLWASPDCKHFSAAKGSKPLDKNVRGLAWVVLRFAWAARPRVIMLENVKEFSKWGPLSRTGRPIKSREGETFDRWISQLQGMGYQIEWRNIKACDHGAPTIRDRLFMIARRDGLPIVWPEPTHGPGRIPYRTAAEVIDWSTPARSIFGRKKPLAEKTLERIAKGLRKFVIEAETPFYLNRNDKHCAPYFTKFYGTATGARIDEPLHTLTAGGGHKFGIVQPELSAFIIKHFGGMVGVDARTPFPTILTRGTQNQVLTAELSPNDLAKLTPEQIARAEKCAAFIIRYNGKNTGQTLREPLGAGTTKPRFALVVVKGNARIITDISMRMLTPREMFTAQGFPLDYVIDRTADGKPITLTDQYVLVGNSVSPPVARALVAANVTDSQAQDRAAA